MTKTIPFILGFALSSVLWFHVSTVGQANVSKDFFARIDHLPVWSLPKVEEVSAAEPVKVTPTWVTDSQKLIETWSEIKLSPTEPEYITKKRVVDALNTFYGESGWDRKNMNDGENNPVDSIDRGFFMFNDYWRKDVSDECAYNFDCANYEAIKTYKSRKGFGAWVAAGKLNIK